MQGEIFLPIIMLKGGNKMTANYHTHTIRCNHAIGSDREYIKKAIECGLSKELVDYLINAEKR